MARDSKSTGPAKTAHAAGADRLAKAIAYHQKGKLTAAKRLYRNILSKDPRNPSALHFLGVLLHAQGQAGPALSYIRRAIAIQPDYVDAHNNLGNILRSEGRLAESEQAYRKAIEFKPDFAFGYNNLGITLKELDRLDESMQAYQQAIALDADYAEAYHNLGNVLVKMEDLNAALTAFRTALILKPGDPKYYKTLGMYLYAAGRADEAVEIYQKWLEQDPDNPVASHMLVACTGENVPERASDEYVKKTFDGFSANFDDNLRNLDYRAPQLVFEAIQGDLSASNEHFDILDAGCGTGLCAEYFKPYAKRLEGVDLSTGMLEKAALLKLYDDLTAAELTAHLLSNPASYDLIISADTLCYFGALDKVLKAAELALRADGRLVFTVEHLQAGDAVAAYRINEHGRYSHTQNYVSEMLCRAGFSLISVTEDTLRSESNQAVAGLVVVAGKI